MKTQYTPRFFADQRTNSVQSAEVIVPLVLNYLKPKSVVDVGCGIGTWLSVFMKKGVKDIQGLDGPWVNQESLLIPSSHFRRANLQRPFFLDRKFDLVVSLEVAEHLPPSAADQFVTSLVALGPAVLFSAAIPYQGGTDHLNEQWQDYWVERFERQGYVAVDCIRKHVWSDKRVAFFYAQNTLLFVKKTLIKKYGLAKEYAETHRSQLSIVHPERYLLVSRERKAIARFMPSFLKKLRLKLLARGS